MVRFAWYVNMYCCTDLFGEKGISRHGREMLSAIAGV